MRVAAAGKMHGSFAAKSAAQDDMSWVKISLNY
jgi:hypothetical protein